MPEIHDPMIHRLNDDEIHSLLAQFESHRDHIRGLQFMFEMMDEDHYWKAGAKLKDIVDSLESTIDEFVFRTQDAERAQHVYDFLKEHYPDDPHLRADSVADCSSRCLTSKASKTLVDFLTTYDKHYKSSDDILWGPTLAYAATLHDLFRNKEIFEGDFDQDD